jgi:hypothetical protein
MKFSKGDEKNKMNNYTKKGVIKTIISFVGLFAGLFLMIGQYFVSPDVKIDLLIQDSNFWIGTGISIVAALTIFFSGKSLKVNDELKNSKKLQAKLEAISMGVSITSLERADEFLDIDYLDRKFKVLEKKYINKLERIKLKANRKGWILTKIERNRFKTKLSEHKFKKLHEKYVTISEILANKSELRDEAAIKPMKLYKPTVAYLSDGYTKFNTKDDAYKPESGLAYDIKKGSSKMTLSILIAAMSSVVGFELINTQTFGMVFWVNIALKILSFSIQLGSGISYGSAYFDDIILGFQIKREMLLNSYIKWLKNTFPDIWNGCLKRKQELEELKMQIEIAEKMKKQEEEKRAIEFAELLKQQSSK